MVITTNSDFDFNVSGLIDYRIAGSFDGATVKLQAETTEGTGIIDLPDASFTEPTTGLLQTAGPLVVSVSGGGGSMNIEINMLEIR